jgi:hypothetical protein
MRKIFLALLLCLLPVTVFAQSTVLNGGPWAQGHSPMYVGNGYSQPIVQDSGPAGGGGPGVGLSEIGITARGNGTTQTAPFAGQGTGPLGTLGCFYDGPTTGPNHYLCFSPNSQGGALITTGAEGGASPIPLNCVVNGVSTSCLGSNSVPVPLNVLLGGAGILTNDGFVIDAQNSSVTGQSIYNGLIPNTYKFFDTTRSVIDLEPGATVQGGSAFGCYGLANVAEGVAPNEKNVVCAFGVVADGVDNAAAWGANYSCGDNKVNGLATLVGRKCVGIELDFTANGASTFEGLSLLMQGPGTPASANALQVSIVSGSTAKWAYAYISDNGAATNGALFGALSTSGTSVLSQPVFFNGFDSSAAGYSVQLQAGQHGLNFTDTTLAHGVSLLMGSAAGEIVANGSGTSNLDLECSGSGCSIFSNSTIAANQQFIAANKNFFSWASQTIPASFAAASLQYDEAGSSLNEVDLINDLVGGGGFCLNQVTSSASAYTSLLCINGSGTLTVTNLGTGVVEAGNGSLATAATLSGALGGTGVANTGRTITLGGNVNIGSTLTTVGAFSTSAAFTTNGAFTTAAAFTQAGAFSTTLTATAISNATLPSGSHTLAGLDVAQSWSVLQTFTGVAGPLLTPVAIASLPACASGNEGQLAFVKDTVGSGAATFHLTVAGGGATTVNSLASCNGSNWQYD